MKVRRHSSIISELLVMATPRQLLGLGMTPESPIQLLELGHSSLCFCGAITYILRTQSLLVRETVEALTRGLLPRQIIECQSTPHIRTRSSQTSLNFLTSSTPRLEVAHSRARTPHKIETCTFIRPLARVCAASLLTNCVPRSPSVQYSAKSGHHAAFKTR